MGVSVCLSFLNYELETEYRHERLVGIKRVRAHEAPRTVVAHSQCDRLVTTVIINNIIIIILGDHHHHHFRSSPLATK